MSFTRKAAGGGWINHSYHCIPYVTHIHSVQYIMHSNQWKLCRLDPVHGIEKYTSTYLCVYYLVIHQLLKTMDVLKLPCISLFHPLVFAKYTENSGLRWKLKRDYFKWNNKMLNKKERLDFRLVTVIYNSSSPFFSFSSFLSSTSIFFPQSNAGAMYSILFTVV